MGKLVGLDWLNSKMLSVMLVVAVIASFRPLIGTVVGFQPLAEPLVALTRGFGLFGSLAYAVVTALGHIINVVTFFKR